jgi:hypothetical protein
MDGLALLAPATSKPRARSPPNLEIVERLVQAEGIDPWSEGAVEWLDPEPGSARRTRTLPRQSRRNVSLTILVKGSTSLRRGVPELLEEVVVDRHGPAHERISMRRLRDVNVRAGDAASASVQQNASFSTPE